MKLPESRTLQFLIAPESLKWWVKHFRLLEWVEEQVVKDVTQESFALA